MPLTKNQTILETRLVVDLLRIDVALVGLLLRTLEEYKIPQLLRQVVWSYGTFRGPKTSSYLR